MTNSFFVVSIAWMAKSILDPPMFCSKSNTPSPSKIKTQASLDPLLADTSISSLRELPVIIYFPFSSRLIPLAESKSLPP